jgi:hypothetical protein
LSNISPSSWPLFFFLLLAWFQFYVGWWMKGLLSVYWVGVVEEVLHPGCFLALPVFGEIRSCLYVYLM